MDKLNQLLSEIFNEEAEVLGEETPFAECPSWDSLKHVELVLGIETLFVVNLSAAEIGRLTCKQAVRQVLTERGIQ